MKVIFKLFIPVLLLTIFTACNRKSSGTARISGTIPNAPAGLVCLKEVDVNRITPVDSQPINTRGTFALKIPCLQAGFYRLSLENQSFILLVVQPGDEIGILGKVAGSEIEYTVEGSDDSRILRDFLTESKRNEARSEELARQLSTFRDSPDFYRTGLKYDTLFNELGAKEKKLQLDFINKNPGSLSSLIILYYTFGGRLLVNPTDDLEYYKKTDSALMKRYPKNKHVVAHHNRVSSFVMMQSLKEITHGK